MMRRIWSGLAALALLTGCQSAASPSSGASSRQVVPSDLTVLTYDARAGSRVEYFGLGGALALWAAGADRVVRGRWRAEPDGSAVCLDYAVRSTDGVVQGRDCVSLAAHRARLARAQTAPGDVFGLLDGPAVPFLLERRRTTLEALRRGASGACGISQC